MTYITKLLNLKFKISNLINFRPKRVGIIKCSNKIADAQIDPLISLIKSKDVYTNINHFSCNKNNTYELLFIQVKWDCDVNFLINFLINVKKYSNYKTKIVFLDWYAPLHIPMPEILKYVDLYVKKQVLSDIKKYYSGMFDTNLIEYESRWNNEFLNTKYLEVDEMYLTDKLFVGWNFATDKLRTKQLKKNLYKNQSDRQIDIHCRMCAPEKRSTWYEHMRGRAYDAILHLAQKHRTDLNILNQNKIISYNDYIIEMSNSKICISPFGYGEVCWRDFEAILTGSLLVKPNMDHISTNPNIYKAYETYIPINWDYSDLEDKCLYYLNNEDERLRIINNAVEVWLTFINNEFPSLLDEVAERLSVSSFIN